MMSVKIKEQQLLYLVILLSLTMVESDPLGVLTTALPQVEKLGAITKWMTDPPPKVTIVKPLVDDYISSYYSHFGGVSSRETLRVEDRVNTLEYSPNIDFLQLNCMALNYDWPSEISLPSIKMYLGAEKHVDIQQIRSSAPSGCIIVLVGARYLKRMAEIRRMVDNITAQLAIKLVTYFGEKTEVMPVVDLNNSPAIVRDIEFKTF